MTYVGGIGVEPGATIVPQRGQCAQATSIGDWQELQVRGAVEVTVAERADVEDLLSSSGRCNPFLEFLHGFPERFREVRELATAKEHQDNHEDQQQLLVTQTEPNLVPPAEPYVDVPSPVNGGRRAVRLERFGRDGPCLRQGSARYGLFVARSPYRSLVINIHFCPL